MSLCSDLVSFSWTGPYLIGALSQRGSYSSPMLVFGVFNLVAGVILLGAHALACVMRMLLFVMRM